MQGTSLTGNTAVLRNGSAAVTQTVPIAWNTTGIATNVKVPGLHISASTSEPVQVEVSYQQTTSWGAATNVVASIGTSSTANEWLSATNIGASTYSPASNAVTKFRLVAETDVYVKLAVTGATATAGAANFYVRIFGENTAPIA